MKMTDNNEPFTDRIKGYVESQCDMDYICTTYVLVATIENFMTSEQKFFTICPPEQVTSTTIGLLESASAAEKLRIARQLLEND